jgi:uncharacterized protein YndB with AHSA1/START domain
MSSDSKTGDKPWKDERTLRVRATPQQMWEAWARPEHLEGWFPDRARGEAEPGGEIVHVWESFGFEMPHRVLEAEPGRLLVLEGRSPQGLPFRQEIHIEQDGAETVLRLVHSGFGEHADWDDEYESGVDSGWKMAFALLRLYLERYWGRPRRGFTLLRSAGYDPAALYTLYSTDQGLSRWLGRAQGLGPAGAEVSVALPGGAPLTGRVLAATGSEICLAWQGLEGALELKAFRMGPERQYVCLRSHSWHKDASAIDSARERVSAAFERLMAEVAAP